MKAAVRRPRSSPREIDVTVLLRRQGYEPARNLKIAPGVGHDVGPKRLQNPTGSASRRRLPRARNSPVSSLDRLRQHLIDQITSVLWITAESWVRPLELGWHLEVLLEPKCEPVCIRSETPSRVPLNTFLHPWLLRTTAASSSARSFSEWPARPLMQYQRTLCSPSVTSRRWHSYWLLTPPARVPALPSMNPGGDAVFV